MYVGREGGEREEHCRNKIKKYVIFMYVRTYVTWCTLPNGELSWRLGCWVMHVCLGKVTYFWARKGTDIAAWHPLWTTRNLLRIHGLWWGWKYKTQILFFLMNLMFVVVKVMFSSTLGRNLANHVRNNNVKNEPCKLASGLGEPGPGPLKEREPLCSFQRAYLINHRFVSLRFYISGDFFGGK